MPSPPSAHTPTFNLAAHGPSSWPSPRGVSSLLGPAAPAALQPTSAAHAPQQSYPFLHAPKPKRAMASGFPTWHMTTPEAAPPQAGLRDYQHRPQFVHPVTQPPYPPQSSLRTRSHDHCPSPTLSHPHKAFPSLSSSQSQSRTSVSRGMQPQPLSETPLQEPFQRLPSNPFDLGAALPSSVASGTGGGLQRSSAESSTSAPHGARTFKFVHHKLIPETFGISSGASTPVSSADRAGSSQLPPNVQSTPSSPRAAFVRLVQTSLFDTTLALPEARSAAASADPIAWVVSRVQDGFHGKIVQSFGDFGKLSALAMKVQLIDEAKKEWEDARAENHPEPPGMATARSPSTLD